MRDPAAIDSESWNFQPHESAVRGCNRCELPVAALDSRQALCQTNASHQSLHSHDSCQHSTMLKAETDSETRSYFRGASLVLLEEGFSTLKVRDVALI